MVPAVQVMRPVPLSGDNAGRQGEASSWSEVRRVSVEQTQTNQTVEPVARTPARLAAETGGLPNSLPPATRIAPSAEAVAPPPPRLVPQVHAHATPVPREGEKQSFPVYRVEPPDILLIEASQAITLRTQPITGQHLVRPDGTLGLGIYGSVYVTGLTLDEVRLAIAHLLVGRVKVTLPKEEEEKLTPEEKAKLNSPEGIAREINVDVLAYNSKVYYVITDGGGYGAQIYRFVATGNETVIDALAQVYGLPAVASKKHIWLARPDHGGAHQQVLGVDYRGIVMRGSPATNYQVFPGDRIYVGSDPRILVDTNITKFLQPIERVFGAVLLGSGTVNSIQGRFGSQGGQ
jgi:polysaccharide biosynthesis/export protein